MISDKAKYLKKLIELDFSFLFSSSTLNNNNNNNSRVIHRLKPLILLTFFKIEYQPVANTKKTTYKNKKKKKKKKKKK